MQGRIIKGIAGFYYVYVPGRGLLECKAKGVFRKEGRKPLVGDLAEVVCLNEEEKTGNIMQLLPRKNELIRPAVANVDQAIVIFAAASPKPNFNLLDRFLLMMERQSIPVRICFNKMDLVDEEQKCELRRIYEATGYELLFVSAKKEEGLVSLSECLRGKTTVVAGPSGVGKSSLVNHMQTDTTMETGAISEKVQRGKHTTRHSQLIPLGADSYLIDTPGFSSLYALDVEPGELWQYFPEFVRYEPECQFQGCMHLKEDCCGVRRALAQGKISESRYEDYCQIAEELKNRKKY